ncbi:spore coat protein [Cohnella yongneupensis]|uniref:Spore coat protein n=1 Tax=Cohnella yongneupensis TaxID=425006 RepID=A0ABW0R3N5_9BACL
MQSQNQNQIANPQSGQLPTVKGPQINDRDLINDALSTSKYLTDSFNIAVKEASHNELHDDFNRILNETHKSARELYNLMFQKGWYKIEAEEQQKLQQAYQQFSGYSSQYPYPAGAQ